MPASLSLTVLVPALSIVRLAQDASIPTWVPSTGFTSITRTDQELSITCESAAVPANEAATEGGWVALRLEGPFAFSLTGILASVLEPLAAGGVSIFAISTFDTDYVLVKDAALADAVAALRAAGHHVAGDYSGS